MTDTHKWCEPPYYPTALDEHWTCPECGLEYEPFDIRKGPLSPILAKYILPGTLGWRTVSKDDPL